MNNPYRSHSQVGTVRQLELLVVVHEQGSITRAAEILHLTQPTVSMQLNKLATTIGMSLYYTSGKRLHFTEVGNMLVESAREILKQFKYLEIKLDKFKGLDSGVLSLSVVTTAQYFIPRLVGDFSEQYPNINIKFKVGNRAETITRSFADEDDFYVFSHPPEDPDLELIDFLPNRLLAIAPEHHPLTEQAQVSLEQFVSYPFLMREPGSGTAHAIHGFLRQQNCQLNVRMTIESNEAIKYAVMSELGVSILSEHTLSYGGLEGLSIVNVENLPIVTQWYLVRRRSRPMSPIAETFLQYVKQHGSLLLDK
ncbi:MULTISPECIES: LysR family transcriptional regulator [unclassified Agarivorans]|uniref:LysR family transcriptional regulator n=1 Tax=unclassified Agarivorans TaxID=2636026 RepID=UPI003D7ED686